jgi:hypothetical protein
MSRSHGHVKHNYLSLDFRDRDLIGAPASKIPGKPTEGGFVAGTDLPGESPSVQR